MIRKKSKFLTFIFSTMFGAGHMYMGFMKQGVSIMSLAVLLYGASTFFHIDTFALLLPILWFYSFFDAINKMTLPDEIFREQKDHIILLDNKDSKVILEFLKKYEYQVALGLIVLGGLMIMDNMLQFLGSRLNLFNADFILGAIFRGLRWDGPRLLFALFIIFIGVRLIRGKKKELDENDASVNNQEFSKNTMQNNTYTTAQTEMKEEVEFAENVIVIKEEAQNENP